MLASTLAHLKLTKIHLHAYSKRYHYTWHTKLMLVLGSGSALVSLFLYYTLHGRIKRKVCSVVHTVVISCITVLYEPYSTVMRLIYL